MKRLLRFFARLSVRLLAFNLLLVFLPIAGVLYLGAYETRLETAEVRAMSDQARVLAAALGERALDVRSFEEIVRRAKVRDVRVRLVDAGGRVVADSERLMPQAKPVVQADSAQHSALYRLGVFLARPLLRIVRPPEPPLRVDFYDDASQLSGPEIESALRGREGFDKKITAKGPASVTLYRTVPVMAGGKPVGAVVASKSTYTILQDLYEVRLGVMRIFVASIVVAFLVSLFFSATIIRPLRQLRVDARSILDRDASRAPFAASHRLDEIGELSRALERIMRRLDDHVTFIEAFASDVSHELKNPLASIRNANEMLAEVGNPQDRRRFSRIIEQEVARMERLISGVREISLVDARLGQEQRARVDLGALLTNIVEGFRLREGDDTRFELQVPEERLVVSAAEDRLIQVFENVLDNAVSFSPDGGTVRVAVTTSNGSVNVRIADEGPGIAEPHVDRIFDRFFTYRPGAAQRDDSHTGLGLAIVQAIVRGYGGTIEAWNDRGAAFEIRLPVPVKSEK
jgi:two-component system sensor histidine kinase ChvG